MLESPPPNPEDPEEFRARALVALEASRRNGEWYSLEEVIGKLRVKWQPKLHAKLKDELKQVRVRGEVAIRALASAQRELRTRATQEGTRQDEKPGGP